MRCRGDRRGNRRRGLLSILYLRCSFLHVELSLADGDLSILYLRCEEGGEGGAMKAVKIPLSILYLRCLRWLVLHVLGDAQQRLSILYLRCTATNTWSLRRRSAKLSILYLRCTFSFFKLPPLLRLSILYLRCAMYEEMWRRILEETFNSLFEMHHRADERHRAADMSPHFQFSI